MRVIKIILSVFAVILATLFLARIVIVSGLVQAGLDTSVGDSIYMSLRNFFGVGGGEDGEGFVIDVVITASFIFVVLVCWLLSKIRSKVIRTKS
ncbi:hypothetical protein N032_26055 [Pseudomonas syringae pv. pisi str. PP1]|uniref:hypothetical protein n=1 Tax=Pseudomonas syringae TaxID=317 RepID=UPI00067EC149|nr:hypothetical protein [Pseudomonas syringae]AZG88845.1 hypothetical protein N032_26055 [Pseudomonas syringae pv. pisi str. PP1]UZS62425.1 hypothetical protein OQB64_25170 [Pseudomonas syringae]